MKFYLPRPSKHLPLLGACLNTRSCGSDQWSQTLVSSPVRVQFGKLGSRMAKRRTYSHMSPCENFEFGVCPVLSRSRLGGSCRLNHACLIFIWTWHFGAPNHKTTASSNSSPKLWTPQTKPINKTHSYSVRLCCARP